MRPRVLTMTTAMKSDIAKWAAVGITVAVLLVSVTLEAQAVRDRVEENASKLTRLEDIRERVVRIETMVEEIHRMLEGRR